MHAHPSQPRPIIVEFHCLGANRNDIEWSRTTYTTSHGPWDGRVLCVVNGADHVEPVWWVHTVSQVSHTISIPRKHLPTWLPAGGDLSDVRLYAAYRGLWPLDEDVICGPIQLGPLGTFSQLPRYAMLTEEADRMGQTGVRWGNGFHRIHSVGAHDLGDVVVVLLLGEYERWLGGSNPSEPTTMAIAGLHGREHLLTGTRVCRATEQEQTGPSSSTPADEGRESLAYIVSAVSSLWARIPDARGRSLVCKPAAQGGRSSV